MVLASVGTFVKDVLHFFFPPICTLCSGRLVESDQVICDRCRQELSHLMEPICRRCGSPSVTRASDTCPLCRKVKPAFDCARAAARYCGPAEQLVHEFKYNERLELAPVMAQIMYGAWQRLLAFDLPDVVIPVPLHPVRQRERGFNQAELLAAPLAALFQKPVISDAVVRVRPTLTQTHLGLRARMENVEGAFAAAIGSDARLRDKCAALIDDVCTTGATGSACAAALKKAGAGRVILFTFARASTE